MLALIQLKGMLQQTSALNREIAAAASHRETADGVLGKSCNGVLGVIRIRNLRSLNVCCATMNNTYIILLSFFLFLRECK